MTSRNGENAAGCPPSCAPGGGHDRCAYPDPASPLPPAEECFCGGIDEGDPALPVEREDPPARLPVMALVKASWRRSWSASGGAALIGRLHRRATPAAIDRVPRREWPLQGAATWGRGAARGRRCVAWPPGRRRGTRPSGRPIIMNCASGCAPARGHSSRARSGHAVTSAAPRAYVNCTGNSRAAPVAPTTADDAQTQAGAIARTQNRRSTSGMTALPGMLRVSCSLPSTRTNHGADAPST